MSRSRRLKASEESESTQSSSAASNHSNETQTSAVTSLSAVISGEVETSDQSYLTDESDEYKSGSRRSKRQRRSISDKWRNTGYESDEDLRRVSLGLRHRGLRQSTGRFGDPEAPIKTRARNSGKNRVRYTEAPGFDDEDFEYDNRQAPHLSEHSVSSRGRVRKFKGHARFGTAPS
jgi:hypothetical protein